jgi:hypothetical protein
VFTQVTPQQVQACLRQAFTRWGLPGEMRLDNGAPWKGWDGLRKALALYLVGLGLGLTFIPGSCPQHNGVVERSQGTSQNWGEPWTAHRVEELQARLDELDRIQREEYPSLKGKTRLAVFPQLTHSGRPYTLQGEPAVWSFALAQEHLAGHLVERQANAQGQVSLYDHRYSIGAMHRKKNVFVYYDLATGSWVFTDKNGLQIRQAVALEITPERILSLTVSD